MQQPCTRWNNFCIHISSKYGKYIAPAFSKTENKNICYFSIVLTLKENSSNLWDDSVCRNGFVPFFNFSKPSYQIPTSYKAISIISSIRCMGELD